MFFPQNNLRPPTQMSLNHFYYKYLTSLLLHCKFAYLIPSGYRSAVQNQLGHNKQGEIQLYV
jgi:hypothetical protein